MPKISRRLIAILVAACALFSTSLLWGGPADSLILSPTTQPIPTPGLKQLVIGQGDQAIEVWQRPFTKGPTKGYVISFNGNGDRAESAIKRYSWMWSGLPVEVWAVNYPGYGGSGGQAELAAITPAALRAFDALKAQAGDKPIIVDGSSLGTTAALSLAAQRPVDFIVLTHPPALREMILQEQGWWNLWILAGPVAASVPDDLDSLANAARCTVPALFLISERDTVVPVKYQKQVAAAYKGKAEVLNIPGNHNDRLPPAAQRQVRQKIRVLWNQTLKQHQQDQQKNADQIKQEQQDAPPVAG